MTSSNKTSTPPAPQIASSLNRSATSRPAAPRPTTQMTVGCVFIPLAVVGIIILFVVMIRAQASSQLTIPEGETLQVYTSPDESSPLLARFAEGRTIRVIGRSDDWRWLEVALWDGRRGWALRPLNRLVWQIKADVSSPTPLEAPPHIAPVASEMITLPATTFTMGSPPGLGEDDERPAHPVTLAAFTIDRTEVTVGQYWACVIAGACAPPSDDASHNEPHYYHDPAFDNYPAINVPWVEANNYCLWQGKRLPTEAEWEMAASWDTVNKAKRQWPWGNDATAAASNLGSTSAQMVQIVGTTPDDVSASGVLDMGGNVSEWVFDWYKVDYYSVADDTNPTGPTHRRGEGTGRVIRGGTYADPVTEGRTTNRRHRDENYGYIMVGFRCAQNLDQ